MKTHLAVASSCRKAAINIAGQKGTACIKGRSDVEVNIKILVASPFSCRVAVFVRARITPRTHMPPFARHLRLDVPQGFPFPCPNRLSVSTLSCRASPCPAFLRLAWVLPHRTAYPTPRCRSTSALRWSRCRSNQQTKGGRSNRALGPVPSLLPGKPLRTRQPGRTAEWLPLGRQVATLRQGRRKGRRRLAIVAAILWLRRTCS